MLKKGTLVVRIGGVDHAMKRANHSIGQIFKTTRNACDFGSAPYEDNFSISNHDWRLATEEEKDYFEANPHIKNISEIVENDLIKVGDEVQRVNSPLKGIVVLISNTTCIISITEGNPGGGRGWNSETFMSSAKRAAQYTAKPEEHFWSVEKNQLILINKNKKDEQKVSRKIEEQGQSRSKGVRANKQKVKPKSSSRLIGSRISNSRRRKQVRFSEITGKKLQFN